MSVADAGLSKEERVLGIQGQNLRWRATGQGLLAENF